MILVLCGEGEPIAAWFDLTESDPAGTQARRGRLLCACDSQGVGDALLELRTPVFTSTSKRHELSLPGAVRAHLTIDRSVHPLTGAERWLLVDADREPIAALEEEFDIGRLLQAGFGYLLPVPTKTPPRVFLLTVEDGPVAAFEVEIDAVVRVATLRPPEPPLDELVLLPLACLLAELQR